MSLQFRLSNGIIGRSFSAVPSITSQLEGPSSFGWYLENRSMFLASIAQKANTMAIHEKEKRLLSILESTGSLIKASQPMQEELEGATCTVRDSFTVRHMLESAVHLGHSTAKWNPKMAPFLFGEREGIHIIHLEKTLACLRQACDVVKDLAKRNGIILFVGTRPFIQRLTYECAQDCGQYYVNLRWLGGTISNREHVLRNDRLKPDLLVVLDYPNNEKAINEAERGNIPTIAICDSDCDPSMVTYPIPANDDSYASVELIAKTLSQAALEGKSSPNEKSLHTNIINSARTFARSVEQLNY